MILKKGDAKVVVTNEIQVTAYLSAGWKKVPEKEPKQPENTQTKKKK